MLNISTHLVALPSQSRSWFVLEKALWENTTVERNSEKMVCINLQCHHELITTLSFVYESGFVQYMGPGTQHMDPVVEIRTHHIPIRPKEQLIRVEAAYDQHEGLREILVSASVSQSLPNFTGSNRDRCSSTS